MNQTPYRRRIVEEWYDTAPEPQDHEIEDRDHEAELGRPILRGDEGLEHADLAGDEDGDEDDEDD